MSFATDLAACDRETGLTGKLSDFVRLAWKHVYPANPLVWNWHLDLLCDHYEACFRGEIRELVVNLPPGGSKSSLTCVLFPAWGWIRNPASRWIFAAYGQQLVHRDARYFLDLLRSKWFQARWGDLFRLPTVPPIGAIENSRKGFRFGTTPGAEVTGWHAHYQVIDDPNKPEDLTKVGLETVTNWEARTMGSRWLRPPEVNSRILIMQRLHCGDLAQTLIDRGAVHICLPANFDPSRRTVTKWGSDPRTVHGELMDPVRLPQDLIDFMRQRLGGINAAAQLDQSPVPEGGAVFKAEHLKYWSIIPPAFDQMLISVDCAFKASEDNDYVAMQVWGRIGTSFYLLDQTHGHFDFPATQKRLVALARKWPLATTIIVEDKANGSGIIQTLTGVLPGIVPIDPKGGKEARAAACAGFFEAGNVLLPDPAVGHTWVDTLYKPELLSFPRAKHDDQVDCTTQALLYLAEHTSYLKSAMAKVRELLGYPEP